MFLPSFATKMLPKMEFFDINLSKCLSLLLYAILSPYYWRILMKTILFFGLKILTKKSAKQENLSLFMNSNLLKMRVENHTKTRAWEDSSFCQENSTKMLFKNSISGNFSLYLDTVIRVYLQIQQTIWLVVNVQLVVWSFDTAAKLYVASKGIFNRHIRVGIDNKKLKPLKDCYSAEADGCWLSFTSRSMSNGQFLPLIPGV
jgi:hypothetical protein